jgi:hypothetical protein
VFYFLFSCTFLEGSYCLFIVFPDQKDLVVVLVVMEKRSAYACPIW